jgi:hypothetical protein
VPILFSVPTFYKRKSILVKYNNIGLCSTIVANKIYYAHMMHEYGTEAERANLDLIRKAFPGAEILNPADFQNSSDMKYYLGLERSCDAVVFSKTDGKIGAGVGEEVNDAINRKCEVFELLRGGGVQRVTESVEHLDVPQTKALLAKHGFSIQAKEKNGPV